MEPSFSLSQTILGNQASLCNPNREVAGCSAGDRSRCGSRDDSRTGLMWSAFLEGANWAAAPHPGRGSGSRSETIRSKGHFLVARRSQHHCGWRCRLARARPSRLRKGTGAQIERWHPTIASIKVPCHEVPFQRQCPRPGGLATGRLWVHEPHNACRVDESRILRFGFPVQSAGLRVSPGAQIFHLRVGFVVTHSGSRPTDPELLNRGFSDALSPRFVCLHDDVDMRRAI